MTTMKSKRMAGLVLALVMMFSFAVSFQAGTETVEAASWYRVVGLAGLQETSGSYRIIHKPTQKYVQQNRTLSSTVYSGFKLTPISGTTRQYYISFDGYFWFYDDNYSLVGLSSVKYSSSKWEIWASSTTSNVFHFKNVETGRFLAIEENGSLHYQSEKTSNIYFHIGAYN